MATRQQSPYSKNSSNHIHCKSIRSSKNTTSMYIQTQALESDGTACYKLNPKEPSAPLQVQMPGGRIAISSSVYGRKWLLAAVDEAHNCRIVNKTYRAVFGLRAQSHAIIAMTATPVNSRPMVSTFVIYTYII